VSRTSATRSLTSLESKTRKLNKQSQFYLIYTFISLILNTHLIECYRKHISLQHGLTYQLSAHSQKTTQLKDCKKDPTVRRASLIFQSKPHTSQLNLTHEDSLKLSPRASHEIIHTKTATPFSIKEHRFPPPPP